jgi:hypothetical protein
MKKKSNYLGRAIIITLFLSAFTIKAQTVPFNNNINCDVAVGYEARDASCNVCDWGSFTILANNNFPLTVGGTCGGTSTDACIWVNSIGGIYPGYTHCSTLNCCLITPVNSGGAPSGCSSSGSFNIVYNYPTSWTINP